MEETTRSSRFASAFMNAAVKSGKKVTASMNPELILTSTKDKFILNTPARDLMGVKPGDHVAIVDLMGVDDEGNQIPQNERFYLAVDYLIGKEPQGAKLDKKGGFSYSGVYSAMLMNDPEVRMCSFDDLTANGKVQQFVSGEGKDRKVRFISNSKIKMPVEVALDGDGEAFVDVELDADGNKAAALYAITGFTFVPHTPQVDSSGEEVAETEE